MSAGDPTAIAAALPVLESLFDPVRRTVPEALAPTSAAGSVGADQIAGGIVAPCRTVLAPSPEAIREADDSVINQWLGRWTRAGWLSERADTGDLVSIAICAGNAGKIARRNVARRNVLADDGWRALAQRLDEADIAYAVTGLISARQDRATAASLSPVIYVDDPTQAVARLDLEETVPGGGVLLIAPSGDEFTRTEIDGGIRFVSRAQGLLDAFAGSGRESDKAESTLRSLLAVSACAATSATSRSK